MNGLVNCFKRHNNILHNRTELRVCVLLVIATLAVYVQMWNQDFISLDDNVYVVYNGFVQGGVTLKGVIWALTNTSQAGLWIPLTWLSLMLDHDLFGLRAGGYKITNLLLHLANIVLVFLVLRKMTGKMWQSAFAATLFALHPLRVESVAWVTERKDVLSALFWLLTMWFYLRYVARPGVKSYLPILVTFTLGLMAKPMLVTLPFALLLLDYWPLQRFRQPGGIAAVSGPSPRSPAGSVTATVPVRRLLLEKLPLLLLAMVVSVGTLLAERSVKVVGVAGGLLSLDILPLPVRIANALVSYVSYLEKTIWPLALGVLYPHPGASMPLGPAVGAGVLLLLISLVVLWASRRYPYLLMGWLWFLVTLLPVIGLLQVGPQALADRFTYVPLVGIFIIIAWGIPDLLSGWRHRRVALSLLATATISAMMLFSWLQVGYWENGPRLYAHTLQVTGDNALIQHSLGVTLLENGDVDAAVRHIAEALRIEPDYVLAQYNMGRALARQGKAADAVNHFEAALRLRPDYAEAHRDLGLALAELGRIPEAVQQFSEALRSKPDYAEAHNNLGTALLRQEKLGEAVAHFTEALRLAPDYAEAHNNLGIALAMEGRGQEAVGHFSEALRLQPDYAEANKNLEIVRASQGRP